LHGLDRGGRATFGGIERRTATYGGTSYTRSGYSGYGYGRSYRYGAYTAGAAAAYAYDRSYASSDDGCYYVSARRYGTRRVQWKLRQTAAFSRPGLAPGAPAFWPNAICRFDSSSGLTLIKLYGIV
jgi:hypothetical protein